MNQYLFVYGTLRSGGSRAHRLLGDARFVAKGTVSGRLYDLGKYPGLRRASGGNGRVGGEVYELPGPDVERRLATVDRYEGADFQRTRVLVRLNDGRHHRAWAYVLVNQPPKGTPHLPTGVYPGSGVRGSRRMLPNPGPRRSGAVRRG